MARLRRDLPAGREPEAAAERVARRDPAQDVLALQRSAGNRAVRAMLQREGTSTVGTGEPWQSPRNWNAFWGGPDFKAKLPPDEAILVLDSIMYGMTPPAAELGGFQDPGIAQAMVTILAHDKQVLYWRTAGCVEIDGDEVHVHTPAPTQAVAGWLGLSPPLPQYLPLVPPGVAGPAHRLPPPAPADPMLKTPLALEVAIFLLENKIARQPYLMAGLADAEHHYLAVKLLAHFCGHLTELTYMINFGMQVTSSDGSSEWICPPPAEAVAKRLGIGPDSAPRGPTLVQDAPASST